MLICCCLVAASGWLAGLAQAQTAYMPFEFDGQKVTGRPVGFKDTHIQIAIQGGGITNVAWGRLSQSTLQSLTKLKNFGVFAQPFIDPPPQRAPQGPKVTIKEVQRMDRPASGGLMASSVMLLVFFLIYLANIYAGYEVAVYRQRNPGLVCTLAAVAPVVTPIAFLAMPSAIERAAEEEAVTEEAAGEAVAQEGQPAEQAPAETAAAEAAAPKPEDEAVVYQRGQFTFNRRFFETKLAGFLKMVPGEAEKDKVLVVSSARGVHTGQRVTRINPNDLILHVVKGGASQDVVIPFTEISEVKIVHKDAV